MSMSNPLSDMQKKDSGQVQPMNYNTEYSVDREAVEAGMKALQTKPRIMVSTHEGIRSAWFDRMLKETMPPDLNARVEAFVQEDGKLPIGSNPIHPIKHIDICGYDERKLRGPRDFVSFHPGHGFPALVRWSVERQEWYDASEKDSCGGAAPDSASPTKSVVPPQDKSSAPAIPPGLPPIPETHELYEGLITDGMMVCCVPNNSGWEMADGLRNKIAPHNDSFGMWYAIRPKQKSGAGAAKAEPKAFTEEAKCDYCGVGYAGYFGDKNICRRCHVERQSIPDQTPAESTIAGRFMERTLEMVARELGACGDQRWIQDNMIEMHIVACQGRVISITEEIEFPANTDDAQLETDRLVTLARKFKEAVERVK